MKTYRLNICDTASVEYSEKGFNNLEKVTIELKNGKRVLGKVLYVETQNLKHEMIILTPVDNFEVIE